MQQEDAVELVVRSYRAGGLPSNISAGRRNAKAERAYNGPIPIEKWQVTARPQHTSYSYSKSYVVATRQSLSQCGLSTSSPRQGSSWAAHGIPPSETLLLEHREPPLASIPVTTPRTAKAARNAYPH